MQGNLKSFTNPKSSPVTITWSPNDASVALISLTWVYLGHIPLTSAPRTLVHVAQWIAWISSLAVTRFPPGEVRVSLIIKYHIARNVMVVVRVVAVVRVVGVVVVMVVGVVVV